MFRQFSGVKLVLGIDLNHQYMQISYWYHKAENVETISSVAGEENYNIPALLCKRKGVNQWYYGKEALNYADENENILVDHLFEMALDGENVRIDGEEFSPVALLALFFKRSLSMVNNVASVDKVDGIMITCQGMDANKKEVLSQVMAILQLKVDFIMYQDYSESFYYYMLSQPQELWFAKACLFDYREGQMTLYSMECNRRTKPKVTHVEEKNFDFLPYDPIPEEEFFKNDKFKRLDHEFFDLANRQLSQQSVSSVYLIGEGFDQDWMKESLKYLCKGRRVFQGNNLYSKGAALSILSQLSKDTDKEYVFLKADKLKCNIGLDVIKRGEPSYIALLDAGISWYEAEKELEFYIKDKNEIGIIVQSLVGRGNVKVIIPLPGLKEDLTRLRLKVKLKDEEHLLLEVTELGLGELCKGEGNVWKEEIAL